MKQCTYFLVRKGSSNLWQQQESNKAERLAREKQALGLERPQKKV